MSKEWSEADDTVGAIASGLIPNFHPHLGSARMWYLFVSEASKKGGHELLGRVRKVSGLLQHVIDKDFLIEIPTPKWNELASEGRTALVDHLLERCMGEEDDKNANQMKWSLRDPEVQEFASILDRHGAWHPGLAGFVAVSKRVNLDGFIDDDQATDLNADESENVEVGGGNPEDDIEV